MLQRIHNCASNTNMSTINCDSYLSKLLKRDKQPGKPSSLVKCPRDRSASRTRSGSATRTCPLIRMQDSRIRPAVVRQQNAPLLKAKPPNVVHKELITDNSAMVEVTVTTHSSKKPRGTANRHSASVENTNTIRQPWEKVLKMGKSGDNLSSFKNFDPLRTLHFLAKELQAKLHSSMPNDSSVLQMVLDMQHALNRVPPEVASTLHLNQGDRKSSRKNSTSEVRQLSGREKLGDKLQHATKPQTEDKSCQLAWPNLIQTGCQAVTHEESEVFQKQLEENTQKLENGCREMEHFCNRLQQEKAEIELVLQTEKNTVQFLRKQLESLEIVQSEAASSEIQEQQGEITKLQLEIKKLKAELEAGHGQSAQELQALIYELRVQKGVAEQDTLTVKHELSRCSMEKEKYKAILAGRDNQIKEIRSEMNQLQELVREQLNELKKTHLPLISQNSSESSIADSSDTRSKHTMQTKCRDATISSINTNESMVQQLFVNNALSHGELESENSAASTAFRELQENGLFSRKRPQIFKDAYCEKLTPTKEMPLKSGAQLQPKPILPDGMSGDSQQIIKDMFADVKRQAALAYTPNC